MKPRSLRSCTVLAALVMLAACSSAPTAARPAVPTPPEPAEPAAPSAGTAVFLNATDVLLLESYPVQVVLLVTGSLSTPCHRLTHSFVDDGSRIDVTLSASSDAEACAQVLAPFAERIALGAYGSGARTVWLNGERVGAFDVGVGATTGSVAPATAFRLRPSEAATLAGDGTLVRFDGVEQDSRCPRDVQCVRAGDATVVLTITPPGGAPALARVLVDPSEGTTEIGAITIRVTALNPAPLSTRPIASADYEVTIVVQP